MLKRYMRVKGIEANLDKRNLSYSIVNTIGGKYLRPLKRPNKGREYVTDCLYCAETQYWLDQHWRDIWELKV